MAVSGLVRSRNSGRIAWKEASLQQPPVDIMRGIHQRCVEYGGVACGSRIDHGRGANTAGFKKVAGAMLAYGVV
jgi:glutamate dehydrogenase (NADP+)